MEKILFQFNHRVELSGLPRSRERYMKHIYFEVEGPYRDKIAEVDANQDGLMHRLEKQLFLQQIDQLWKDHLTTMDQLRTGIGLRGYGQRDPKKEYQKEGFRMFTDLMHEVKARTMGQLYRIQIESEEEVLAAQAEYQRRIEEQQANMRMLSSESADEESPDQEQPRRRVVRTVRRERPKIGRNDPCWCGSGKKYKKCHMASDLSGETMPTDDSDNPPEPSAEQ